MFEVFSLQTGEVVIDLRLKVQAPAPHVEPDEFFALTKALHLTGTQVKHLANLVELQNRCPEKHVAMASQKLKVHGKRLDHCMNFRKAEFVVFIHNRDSWLRCKGDNSRPIFFVTYTVTYMKFPCSG